MDVNLQFLGAAHCVTGSRYLLTLAEAGTRHQLLVDCGLFEGAEELRLRNREELPLASAEVEIVVLTHAHPDHSGYLPQLVKDGFRGRILCTEPAADLLSIMLLDSARLQAEEAAYANHKGYARHHPALPLYAPADVAQVLPLVESVAYDAPISLLGGALTLTFREAGHQPGAAIAELDVRGAHQRKRLVFSGDLGHYDDPLLHAPAASTQADVLLVESTYGDRTTRLADPETVLARTVNEALDRSGVLLIAAAAGGRAPALLYYLKKLLAAGRIPPVPVYVDSPLARRVADFYPRHPAAHRLGHGNVFDFAGLHLITEEAESKALNRKTGWGIILAPNGMCTGGRIVHHLHYRLPRPQDTLLLIGHQAEGTRGRQLLNGAKELKIFGETVPVHCHIEHLDGFSAHADRPELLRWLDQFQAPPQRTFVVHGEAPAAEDLAAALRMRHWPNVGVPEYLESVSLFEGI
ncbi:MBL fold metallo-hydrolase [Hymenobacter terrigena]